MLINKPHKNFTNVSFYTSTIKATEPLGLTWNMCDAIINFTTFKNNIVITGCFVEVILITRVLRYSITIIDGI